MITLANNCSQLNREALRIAGRSAASVGKSRERLTRSCRKMQIDRKAVQSHCATLVLQVKSLT